MDRRFRDCLRLNGKLAALALSGNWIGPNEVAASYDALAPGYEENWLAHLRPVTQELLNKVPDIGNIPILDLGCGTGFTAGQLNQRFPTADIRAQDISAGMLAVAKENNPSENITFNCSDMLAFISRQPSESAGLVVSAWAIGYSNPRKILKESFRVLESGGTFAFVVNIMQTLRPVYIAFRKTMQRYPEKLSALTWPRFPASWAAIEKQANAIGFETIDNASGQFEVRAAGEASLDWLLKTGILAGFDAMLPLTDDPQLSEYFEQCLKQQTEPLEHHYIMAVLQKP
ncbi:class I SAM-dependent methyltransferase [Pontiellaceae bacterium B1224]|nr:class I SAM-dependent methyltransferase [Pontiellaceae bacterium B1224]